MLPACFLIAVVAAASSCRGNAATSSAKAARDVVRLNVGLAQPPSGVAAFITTLVAEPLVGISWEGRPVARAIADWHWSEDRLSLTLKLRDNLKFHDGTAIDIKYFKESLQALFVTPQPAGTNVSYQSVTGVTLDPDAKDQVIVRLSRAEAFLLTDLANSSIRHPTDEAIGTGPYKRSTSDKSTILTAFDGYYRGRPRIDVVEVQNFADQRASWAALMRGEIDAVQEIAPTSVDFVQAEGQTAVRTYSFVRPYYFQLYFNVRHPVLKNPVVRQALSYGVDRQAIVDLALNKQGTVAEGPIWPYHWAYSTAQKVYTHNSEAATLRLDSAGLKMKSSPTKGAMPSRLRVRCLTVAKDPRYEKIALILQKQLYEIGVDLEIETLPGADVVKRLTSGDFDTVLIERTSGRSLAWTYLSFHSTFSPSGYNAADTVLERLRQITADAEIRASVGDLQRILYDDPPAIFIAWPKVTRGLRSTFTVPDEAGRDVLSSLAQWRRTDSTR